MTFANESQMYEIIAEWLLHRNQDACLDAVSDLPNGYPFSFKFGSKRHKVDVLGFYYDEDEEARFVGVEVKLTSKEILTASRQAFPMKSFCHEVYVAVPHEDYSVLSRKEQEELRSQLRGTHIGLLLVKEPRSSRASLETLVSPILDVEPIAFRQSIHKQAVSHFKNNYDSEKLLERFTTATGKRYYRWLNEVWSSDRDGNWWHTHSQEHVEFGRVIFNEDNIVIEVPLNPRKFIELAMVDAAYEIVSSVWEHMDETKVSLVIFDDTDGEQVTIDLEVFRTPYDSENLGTLHTLPLFLSFWEMPYMKLRHVIERNRISLEVDSEDLIDELRRKYDHLLNLAKVLGSFRDV